MLLLTTFPVELLKILSAHHNDKLYPLKNCQVGQVGQMGQTYGRARDKKIRKIPTICYNQQQSPCFYQYSKILLHFTFLFSADTPISLSHLSQKHEKTLYIEGGTSKCPKNPLVVPLVPGDLNSSIFLSAHHNDKLSIGHKGSILLFIAHLIKSY